MSAPTPILRHYETVILIRPDSAEESQNTVRQRIGEIIGGAGGRVARWETWGKRRLAYEIRKQNKAFYLYSNYVTSQESIFEIERNLRILEPVLKFQTIRLAEEVDMEAFPFETLSAARTQLYLSPEDAAA
ncbi:MAG: small subunit ribosomal protein S6, partial [Myxococcota bacterium]